MRTYFGLEGTRPYTGAFFERQDGGGDRPAVVDEITTADLVAVTMLGINVPAYAALEILGRLGARIHDLLSAIPTDLELSTSTPPTPLPTAC